MLHFTADQLSGFRAMARERFLRALDAHVRATVPEAAELGPDLAEKLLAEAARRGAVTEGEVAQMAVLMLDAAAGHRFGPAHAAVVQVLDPGHDLPGAGRLDAIHAMLPDDLRGRYFPDADPLAGPGP